MSADDVVVNNTVKLTSAIVCGVKSDVTEAALTADIQKMMTKLIPSATWQFSGLARQNDQSGLERVTTQATTRVAEAENKALDKRIREVSIEGMNIIGITADITPPAWMIEPIESKLRQTILTKALKEIDAINTTVGGGYRLGSVQFHVQHASSANVNRVASATFAAEASAMGGGAPAGLGNTVRLTMVALIILRKHAKA